MTSYFDQITAWASWALDVTDGWDDTTTPAQTWAAQARDVFADAACPCGADRAGTDTAAKDRLPPDIDAARRRLAGCERRILRGPGFGDIEHTEWGKGPG
jgi:hypothetical protein